MLLISHKWSIFYFRFLIKNFVTLDIPFILKVVFIFYRKLSDDDVSLYEQIFTI